MLYLAYGSNLSKTRMAARCPAAMPLRAVLLPGWRLRFERVATIEPAAGSALPGALYRLTPACTQVLDAVEGVAEGRYARVRLRLPAGPEGAVGAQGVLTYIKRDARRGAPTPAYLGHIAAGYRDWGHDPAALAGALARVDGGD
jgi:gamma-glutamylcyclotransferase (GGCT)/AIG2-like uncharacterized protein YtfP